MTHHKRNWRRVLRLASTISISCLLVLQGTTVWAQSPDVDSPAAFDSPDNSQRPQGDRGGERGARFSRGGRGPGVAEEGSGSSPAEERRGARGRRDESGSGNQPLAKPGAKSKVRVGRIGPKSAIPMATTLPAQYLSRDTNRDGQIGLYEWSRTDISTFHRLDTNHDGFLIPAELVHPDRGASGAIVAITSAAISVPGAAGSFAASASTPVKPTAPSGPAADPKLAAAESAFDYLDKQDASGQKDGLLSAEEWERSRGARKLFSEAKVEVQLPLTKAKFVENYVKLSK